MPTRLPTEVCQPTPAIEEFLEDFSYATPSRCRPRQPLRK
jgi:hypothetical protein